jgi:hypothetical protein
MRRALLLAALLLVTSVSAGPVARASGDEVAAAQVLFEEGRRRMAEHDYAGACPKLEESQHLAPGAGTEFNLADCWEKVDRLASAWAAFLDVADLTHRRGEPDRERAARDRAASLEPRLGRITIDVPPAQRLPELAVQRDGQDVREALWGVSVPVDAGEHRVDAKAPGRRPWTMIVRAADGQTIRVAIPDLPATPSAVEFAPPERPATEPAVPSVRPSAPLGPWIALGGSVVLAGVGILGLAEYDHNVGSYNSDGACPSIGAATRPAPCQGFVDAANTWKTVAVVDFVASALALAGAATLWITTPHPLHTAEIRCRVSMGSVGCAAVF